MKRAALAGFALHPDSSVHQMHERRGDRQPKSGPAESPRRRTVGLAERFEDRRVLFR